MSDTPAYETEILRTGSELEAVDSIRAVVDMLHRGEVVALPTETVYGLGADAFDAEAVGKIFTTKERPSFDPLIVHVPNKRALHDVAQVPEELERLVARLTETFWPGPLTVLLPKAAALPDVVTAGLPTVGVRMSDHPMFKRVMKHFGGPLAAPSANLFGQLSPTSCAAVESQLSGRIPAILDGGACGRGLESTIVRLHATEPKPTIEILRPGPITAEDLKPHGKVIFAERNEDVEAQSPEAPGMLASHYAPSTPLRLLSSPQDFKPEEGKRYALLSYRGQEKDGYLDLHEWDEISILSPGSGRVAEAGIRLFHVLFQLDQQGFDEIVAEPVPDRSVGKAILEKLRKASFNQ